MGASPQLYRIMGLKFTRIFVSSEDLYPEEKLWRAVVINALEDCSNLNSDRKSSLQKINAHNWVTSNSKDFNDVCNWGRIDPEDVQQCYIRAVKQKKIYFNVRQVMWWPYDKLYKKMLVAEPNSKRLIRKKLDELRDTINFTEDVSCSTVFVSVFS